MEKFDKKIDECIGKMDGYIQEIESLKNAFESKIEKQTYLLVFLLAVVSFMAMV